MSKPAKPRPGEKAAASPAPSEKGKGAKDAKPAPRVAAEPLILNEKIFVRTRPERVYFAAVNPLNRAAWDKGVMRARYAKPKGGEAATKPAPGVLVELFFPLRLGGVFQVRYALMRQPQGFALEAVRGSFGLLAGLAETWQFVAARGGTEVTLTRSLVPRFKPVKNYVERTQRVTMKKALEGLKKFVEEGGKEGR